MVLAILINMTYFKAFQVQDISEKTIDKAKVKGELSKPSSNLQWDFNKSLIFFVF